MLLLKLGWIVSECQRKMYITKAQLRLANTGQACSRIFALVSGDRNGANDLCEVAAVERG